MTISPERDCIAKTEVSGLEVAVDEVVALAVEYGASDIHFKAGLPPVFRIDGQLRMLPGLPSFDSESLTAALIGLLSRRQQKLFEEQLELDTALVINGKVYYGYQSPQAIEQILPQLASMKTASSTETTSTKK